MNLYLGFEFAPIEGWEHILPAPKAPSNYKDKAKISAYIAKEVEKLRDGKAATDPLSGSLSRVVILGNKGGKVEKLLDATGNGPQSVSHQLTEFLGPHMDTPEKRYATTLFGHKIHKAMRLCGIELISDNSSIVPADRWLFEIDPEFRYGRIPGYVDPVSTIFGSSDTDLIGVSKRLKLKKPKDDAESMAELALMLAARLGF